MTKSLFITATGTDVGKTYVSALLVKKMRKYGYNCGYYKPVLSGAKKDFNGSTIAGDCKYVTEIADLKINPMKCLTYCFEEAVSPHLASKRAGINISLEKIKNDYENLKQSYDYMILEGAGGITCPLTDAPNKQDIFLLSDLIQQMNKNILIIADGGLGTINSVLTTVEYAHAHNINIKGIILNNFDKDNFMHCDNLYMIEKMTGINIIATVEKNQKDININKDILESLFKED